MGGRSTVLSSLPRPAVLRDLALTAASVMFVLAMVAGVEPFSPASASGMYAHGPSMAANAVTRRTVP